MEAKRNILFEKWHFVAERSADGSLNNDMLGEIIFVNSWSTLVSVSMNQFVLCTPQSPYTLPSQPHLQAM